MAALDDGHDHSYYVEKNDYDRDRRETDREIRDLLNRVDEKNGELHDRLQSLERELGTLQERMHRLEEAAGKTAHTAPPRTHEIEGGEVRYGGE